jgi:KRAB domain-containing zinc finger protein
MSNSKYQQQFDEGRSLNWHDLLGWEKEVAASEYKCSKCGKEFKLKIGLNLHIRTQNCEKAEENSTGFTSDLKKTFEYYKCDKLFKRKDNLTQHLATHELEKRFECRICKKFLKTKSILNQHLQSHEPGKKFVCRICGNKFKYDRSLRRHGKLHKPDKKNTRM